MRKLTKVYAVSLLAVLLFAPSIAGAVGNIHLGALQINPYLTISETYTDNVYSTFTNTEDDYITSIMPGLNLELPFLKNMIVLDGNINALRNSKHTEESTTDKSALGMIQLELGKSIGLALRRTGLSGHEGRSSTQTGRIEKFKNISNYGSFVYKFVDISKMQVDYTVTKWSYSDAAQSFRDRKERMVSGYLYYKPLPGLLPKTSGFVEYDRTNVEYAEDTSIIYESVIDAYWLGVTWELNEGSKAVLKGGYQSRTYDSTSTFEDVGENVASLSLSHAFTRQTSFEMSGARLTYEPQVAGQGHTIKSMFMSKFTHIFPWKAGFSATAMYGQDEYPFETLADGITMREDDVISIGAGLVFLKHDWIDVSLDYIHMKKDSNLDTDPALGANTADFESNTYTISIAIKL